MVSQHDCTALELKWRLIWRLLFIAVFLSGFTCILSNLISPICLGCDCTARFTLRSLESWPSVLSCRPTERCCKHSWNSKPAAASPASVLGNRTGDAVWQTGIPADGRTFLGRYLFEIHLKKAKRVTSEGCWRCSSPVNTVKLRHGAQTVHVREGHTSTLMRLQEHSAKFQLDLLVNDFHIIVHKKNPHLHHLYWLPVVPANSQIIFWPYRDWRIGKNGICKQPGVEYVLPHTETAQQLLKQWAVISAAHANKLFWTFSKFSAPSPQWCSLWCLHPPWRSDGRHSPAASLTTHLFFLRDLADPIRHQSVFS